MIELSASAMEWLAVGGLLTIAGASIKFRGWTFLLAGYDETSPVPDDVVADVAGNAVLRIGLAVTGVGVATAVADLPSYVPLVVGGAILVEVLRLLYRLNTYSPSRAA